MPAELCVEHFLPRFDSVLVLTSKARISDPVHVFLLRQALKAVTSDNTSALVEQFRVPPPPFKPDEVYTTEHDQERLRWMTEVGNPVIASMRGKQLRSRDASGFSQGYSLLYAAFVELAQVKLNALHKEKFVPSTVLSGKKKKESLF